MAARDDKLRRAAIAGGIAFIVIELVLLVVELPMNMQGYDHAAALVLALMAFFAVLLN